MHFNSDERLCSLLECYIGLRHGLFMRILTTLILLVLSLQAHAYSKPNHKRITEAAVDLIQRCELPIQLNDKQVSTLVALNIGQDGIFRKMRLWHFPAPLPESNSPAPQKKRAWLYGKLVTETTFDRWVKYLDEHIRTQAELEQRLSGIGALLHYVQDLAVPAHAVPIFHPSRIANGDKLDDWKKMQPDGPALLPATQTVCETISTGSVAEVSEFLNATRRATLISMQRSLGPDCQGSNCRWSRYWSEAVLENGFADYGCDGKDVFGKATFNCEGDKYTVKREVYSTFAADRFQDAVIASAQVLAYYLNRPAGDEMIAPQWLPNKKLLEWVQRNY